MAVNQDGNIPFARGLTDETDALSDDAVKVHGLTPSRSASLRAFPSRRDPDLPTSVADAQATAAPVEAFAGSMMVSLSLQ